MPVPVRLQVSHEMVLSDASPNVVAGLKASASVKSTLQDDEPQKKPEIATPRAVQSMLKTTTELGDLGQFSKRPLRGPPSRQVHRTRPRSGSFDAVLVPKGRHHRSSPHHRYPKRHPGPRPTPSLPALASYGTVRSNLTSSNHNPRSIRRYETRYHKDHAANPRPSNSHARVLHTHRSLMTLRSHPDFTRSHSTIPSSYHGGGRSYHRTSSPALSEATSFQRPYWSRFNRDASFVTAASSPVSLIHAPGGAAGYLPDLNRSIASFVRLPSPAIPNGWHGMPSRSNTPMSMSRFHPREGSSGSMRSTPGLPRSPTGSSAPHYYDYTEPFIEEDRFSPALESMGTLPLNMDQTILENGPPPIFRQAQSPFGTRPGSIFQPSELPTTDDDENSEDIKVNVAIPKRESSLFACGPIETSLEVGVSVSRIPKFVVCFGTICQKVIKLLTYYLTR